MNNDIENIEKIEMITLEEKLNLIQDELKVPKTKASEMGYKYRTLGDITDSLKPLLTKYKVSLTLDNEIAKYGEENSVRYYVKSTATLINIDNNKEKISKKGYAREVENSANLDPSQITGSASTYANKYALNNLFLLGDVEKDADSYEFKDLDNSENEKFISKSQENAIKKIAKDDNKLIEYINKKFNKTDIKQLTHKEAVEILNYLQDARS